MIRKPLFFALLIFSVAGMAFANSPDSCSPDGRPNVGGSPPFDWVANGTPRYGATGNC